MREPGGEGSPYPKADLTLRGGARAVDLALGFALAQTGHQVGPLLAVAYLLFADGMLQGQSIGKRLFGIRAVVVPRRAPAGYRDSVLRNAPFALVALFYVFPPTWILLVVAGLPIVVYEAYRVWKDPLGLRMGDVFADTQVVDAKVVSKAVAPAGPRLGTVAPAPPGPSATVTRRLAATRAA